MARRPWFGKGPPLGYGARARQDQPGDPMLTALRSMARTWVAKLLFALLILSFAVWGIEDTVRNFGRDDAVARVGGEAIEMEPVQTATRREAQRLANALGPEFELTPQIRTALVRQALDGLVMERVLRQESDRLGLAAPEEAVREAVFALEGFRGLDGRFSRAAFDNFLRANGLTEAQFLDFVRADLMRRQMTEAVRAGAAAPDALATPLLGWEREQRAATVVVFDLRSAPEPEPPTEAQLRRFHENNPDRYSTPEYRVASVATLTADRVLQEVEVPEADIAAAFEANRDRYNTPEKRALEQLLVQEEERARELAAAWRAGAPFSEVAGQAEAAGGTALELGTITREELPVPELAEAGFGLPAGAVSEPVRSPFGWHVLRVVRVEPARTPTLDEAREQVRNQIAAERAADLAFERSNQVEDALAGGATLAEVAQRFNLGFAEIRTDAEGEGPDGQAVRLPVIEASREPLLAQVFRTPQGAAPRLQETEAGFVAVAVQEVIPPTLRPFETVETEVRGAYLFEARRRALEERAAGLLAAAQAGGGRSLAELAAEAGLGSSQITGIRRDADATLVPPELVAPLFEAPLNGATMAATRTGFAVGQVTGITRPDPATQAEALSRVRAVTEQTMAQDLEVQFLSALRARADVRVNPRLVEQIAQP